MSGAADAGTSAAYETPGKATSKPGSGAQGSLYYQPALSAGAGEGACYESISDPAPAAGVGPAQPRGGKLAGANGVTTYGKAGAQAMNVYDSQHYLVPSEVGTAKRGAGVGVYDGQHYLVPSGGNTHAAEGEDDDGYLKVGAAETTNSAGQGLYYQPAVSEDAEYAVAGPAGAGASSAYATPAEAAAPAGHGGGGGATAQASLYYEPAVSGSVDHAA